MPNGNTPTAPISSADAALAALNKSIAHALEMAPAPDVLNLLTGHFVGLTVELVRRQGLDGSKEIQLDGGSQRDITIHRPKGLAHG